MDNIQIGVTSIITLLLGVVGWILKKRDGEITELKTDLKEHKTTVDNIGKEMTKFQLEVHTSFAKEVNMQTSLSRVHERMEKMATDVNRRVENLGLDVNNKFGTIETSIDALRKDILDIFRKGV